MKDIEGFQARSLENAGLKGDLIISPIMSPFTTEEGNETWQSVLTSRLPVQGKKPPAPKAQKGYASDEQRKKYYLSMYELVSGALLDGICQGISEIDTKMNDDYEQRLDRVGYSSLESSSAVRSDDLISKNPVFLTFNGKCFGSLLPSAFDVATSLKLALTSTLFQFAEYGADLIVLLFESAETVNSLADAASEVASLLRAYTEKLPKRKNRQSITFTTKYISSMAELDFYLENQMKISQNPRPVDCDRNVTVLLLENLSEASIVPKSPDYIEEVSDDEEDAIPIGISEYKEAKIKAWKALEPRNLPVSIQVLGKSYTINCLTDAAAALARLVLQYKAIVVQGDIGSFFPVSNSVLARSSFMNTLVTDRVRDSMNWLSVLLSFPKVSSLRSRENRSGAELYSFGDYLSYLFPNSISDPSLIFTIGGTIRSTKFRFLEYAIDLVRCVTLYDLTFYREIQSFFAENFVCLFFLHRVLSSREASCTQNINRSVPIF